MTMKSFKNYITEEPLPEPALYVTVRSGSVQLCSTDQAMPCSSFGNDIVSAVIQGDIIVATTKNGTTQIWRINKQSRTVYGPVTTR